MRGLLVMPLALVLALVLVMLLVLPAQAAPPKVAYQYKSLFIRSAHFAWGLDAPTATLAAQIHTESVWRNGARSPVGAQGLAQFMPSTAKWISGLYPFLKTNEPDNPAWAFQAQAAYMKLLWGQVKAKDNCNRMAKALAAYNGGLGWVQKDERLATVKGLNRQLWWDNVETVNAGRRLSAKRENTRYPRMILLQLEPVYMQDGWGGGMCHD